MSRPRIARLLGMLLALATTFGIVSEVSAQKAAIVTGTRSGENRWWQYVKDRIVETGLYPGGVDQIDAAFRDPTTAQLLPYKLVVILSSDYGLSSADGVGNALGDYLTMSPTASVLMFQPYTFQTGLFAAPAVSGSFLANYALTTQGNGGTTASTKRGKLVSGDPLVEGLRDFTCGSGCMRVTGQVAKPGTIVAATWEDGTILAARGKRRVDLNMYPADDSVITGSWKSPAADLITNSILYLSAPILQTPRKVAFGSTGLGIRSNDTTVNFRNISDGVQNLVSIGVDGTGKSHFQVQSTKTLPLALPLRATLPVQVAFKPQARGAHKAKLFLNLSDGSRIEAPLEGTGVGDLYVTGSPIDFGGIPLGTMPAAAVVRLKNTGVSPIELDKPVIGDPAHYDLKTAVPDAKITMFPGATYSFEVKFNTGMTAGEFSSDVTINSTDASSPLSIPIRGLAGPPAAQVAYTSILLPDVPATSRGLPMEINITNNGFSDLSITEISSSKTDFEVPNAPTAMSPLVIAARQTKTFQLIFAPQMEGLRTGKITIKSNEPAPMGMPTSDKYIDLAGTGTKPKFNVAITSLDFGTVNIGQPAAPKTVDMVNDGDGDIMIKDVSIMMGPGSDSFSVATPDSVPFLLRAGSTVSATVNFLPKGAGMLGGTLRIVSDLAGGAATVSLKGEANGAVGQLNPAMLSFGDSKVKQKVSKSFSLQNTGNQDLTILKSRLTPTVGVYAVMLPADGTKIAAGKSLSINVDCIPAMIGAATAKVELETDDPAISGGTKFTVNLSVNGVVGNVSLSPTVLDFSTPVYVGQKSAPQMLKITNTGNVVIDNIALKPSGPDSGDFTIVTGFKTKLNPGEASDIGVVFEPRVAKPSHIATLVIEADGVQVAMTVALKGTSMSPLVTIAPNNLRFDRTFVGDATQPKFIILSNDGSQPLELEVIPPASEDFTVDLMAAKLMLAPGDSTKLPVTFNPKTTGQKSENLEVRLKGTQLSIASVGMEGDAVVKPMVMTMEGGCSQSRSPVGTPLSLLLVLAPALLLLLRRRTGTLRS